MELFDKKGFDTMITNEKALELLKDAGVLLEGHFLLTSGRHSNRYLQCAKIFKDEHPEDEVIFVTNDLICRHIASMYFTTEKVVEEEYDYDGYKEVFLDEDGMTEFYSNPEANLYDLHINEYLLVHNTDGECVDRLCWTGNGYRHLSYNSFNSRWFGDVKPMKGDVY